MTAIPLCIPNNCSWDEASRVLQRDYSQYRTGLKVVNEAWRKLRSIQGPVCVVSIAGPSRSGKSHILSEAFDQSVVFPLGYSLDPETAGIWMWVVPEKFKDNHGREFTVVLLEEEGAGAVSAFDVNGDVIFSLTILLSSVLIYNSSGIPTRIDLEGLDPAIKNFQRIISLDDETCRKGFPSFVLLLRDVLISPPKDVENFKDYFLEKVFKTRGCPTEEPQKDVHSILKIFPDFDAFKLSPPSIDIEVVQNLNEPWAKGGISQSFWEEIVEFKQMLRSKLNPKQSFVGEGFLTGGALATLVEGYVRSTNSPVTGVFDVPFTKKKCAQALNDAKAVYEGGIRKFRGKVRLPCDDKEIHSSHENHLQEALTFFESATKDTTEMARLVYIVELVSYTEKVEGALLMENKKLTEEQYEEEERVRYANERSGASLKKESETGERRTQQSMSLEL